MGTKTQSMALAVVCLTSAALAACGGGDADTARQGNRNGAEQAAASNNAGGAAASSGNLEEEIARLERQAERNPSDDTVRASLAQAYVKRGNSLRASNDLKGALRDYRRAIIHDEDNLEAQKNIAELSQQVEGERTGEYGEPEPPPISPGVTAGEDDATPAQATPTPTPRRRP